LNGPDAFIWKDDSNFVIRGKPEMKGQLSHYDTQLTFSVTGFPPDLTMQLGDRRGTTRDDGSAHISVEIMPLYATLPVGSLNDAKLDHHLSLVITPNEAPPLRVPLPPVRINPYTLASLLKKAQDGPVLFGDEPARPPGPPRSVIDLDDSPPKVYGPARTLGDVDAIALQVRLPEPKGERKCGGYKDKNKQPLPPVTLLLKETEVTIYDRRAGGAIDKRRFAPKDECPMFLFRFGDEGNTTDSYAPRDQIAAWLRDYVAGVRPETVEVQRAGTR
jgi:hypothetical protein